MDQQTSIKMCIERLHVLASAKKNLTVVQAMMILAVALEDHDNEDAINDVLARYGIPQGTLHGLKMQLINPTKPEDKQVFTKALSNADGRKRSYKFTPFGKNLVDRLVNVSLPN